MRLALLLVVCAVAARAQPEATPASSAAADDPIRTLVARLDLERYKATIKGLTQFGDRRQGTDRNRDAIDWIEAKLKSYGCANTERLKYTYSPQERPQPSGPPGCAQPRCRGRAAGASGAFAPRPASTPIPSGSPMRSCARSTRRRVCPVRARRFTAPRSARCIRTRCTSSARTWTATAGARPRTTTAPAPRWSWSWRGSCHRPMCSTERSIRFVLWNNEETGLNGSHAYVAQRAPLQGREYPPGSGQYPEPKWLGMIQHDMMLFDHGMPRADGTVAKEQRPEADVNIEFQIPSQAGRGGAEARLGFLRRQRELCHRLSGGGGPHMTNTDSHAVHGSRSGDQRARERARPQIGAGWDPHWHQPTDVYATFSDQDFRLGLNAAQTTLGSDRAPHRRRASSVVHERVSDLCRRGTVVCRYRGGFGRLAPPVRRPPRPPILMPTSF